MTNAQRSTAYPELPFVEGQQALIDALESAGCAVIQAPPGTGKTTLAPGYVRDVLLKRAGHDPSSGEDVGASSAATKVIVTQPRRVAARSAAARIAEITGTTLGEEIGYTVRGDSKTSARTSIEFVTSGVLLRRLLRDPDLEGVGAVIIDEVHERHLESDLIFGMLAQLRELLRDDLLLVAMSATVDAARFAALLDDAPIVDVPSPIHPLEISYASAADSISTRDQRARIGAKGSVEDHVEGAIRQALSETTDHEDSDIAHSDLLAFVPTIRGTELLAERLHGSHIGGHQIEAFALHGRLSPKEQSRIVRGRQSSSDHNSENGRSERESATSANSLTSTRRVIIATDVAESSLTVSGVRVVVDSCLSRVARRDASRGMSLLVTESASQASTVQRAGRAGREGPGVVYRCMTAEQWAKLPEFSPPAIVTSDLTSALLDCAVWGAPGGEDLPLPDPFPQRAAQAATTTLTRLGAVDASGAVTDLGRLLASIPLDPHLARGGLLACQYVDVDLVARVLFVLDATPHSPNPSSEVKAARGNDPMVSRIAKILRREAPRAARIPELQLPDGDSRDSINTATGTVAGAEQLTGDEAIAFTIACAFPHLIARRVTNSDGSPTDRVLTVGGTGATLNSDIPGAHSTSSHWFAIVDLARSHTKDGTGARVRSALPIPQGLAERAAGGVEKKRTATFDQQAQKVRVREVKQLGAIEMSSAPVQASPEEAQEAVAEALREHGTTMLPLNDNAKALLRRMTFLHAQGVEGYPDLTHGLPEEVVSFAAADLAAGRTPDITGLLRGLIPWDKPIDELAPEQYEMPNGRRAKVSYPKDGDPDGTPPIIATKLQDAFGLHESPRIAGAKVQFHLLSPAQRPLAVTDDLASFWAGPYQGVRKDMRGRYPKHDWPEDPASF